MSQATPTPALSVDALIPLVYRELRAVARRERLRVSAGETLLTTALVHEAYLRLREHPALPSRADFLRLSAVAMRRVLVDRVREQMAAKRGGGAAHLSLDQLDEQAGELVIEDGERLLGVESALQRLSAIDLRLVEVVECRFFAGYTEPETAEALGISERSVQRHWALARAWLKTEMAV